MLVSVRVELTMTTPATVSSTTRTSTVARAEPRSPYELPGAGIRGPGCGDLIPRDCATARPRDCRRRVSPFPRFPAFVSSSISVSAGPGDGNDDVVRCSRGEGSGKVVGDRRVVPDGHAARAAGVLQGDAAVGQDNAVQRDADRVRAVPQIDPYRPRGRRLCVRGACAKRN